MRTALLLPALLRALRGAFLLSCLLLIAQAAPAQDAAQPARATSLHFPESSRAASSSAKSDPGPLFFGKDFLRGYTDFEIAPPHNEPDLGRCNQPQPNCSAFARYIIGGYLEFQPFARTPLRHLYFFYEPRFFFGDNIPQVKYTYSMAPLAYEKTLGLAVALPKHFELRITNHGVTSFSPFDVSLGPYDSGPDKEPLGIYNTVGVRWYFGGYEHYSSSW